MKKRLLDPLKVELSVKSSLIGLIKNFKKTNSLLSFLSRDHSYCFAVPRDCRSLNVTHHFLGETIVQILSVYIPSFSLSSRNHTLTLLRGYLNMTDRLEKGYRYKASHLKCKTTQSVLKSSVLKHIERYRTLWDTWF